MDTGNTGETPKNANTGYEAWRTIGNYDTGESKEPAERFLRHNSRPKKIDSLRLALAALVMAKHDDPLHKQACSMLERHSKQEAVSTCVDIIKGCVTDWRPYNPQNPSHAYSKNLALMPHKLAAFYKDPQLINEIVDGVGDQYFTKRVERYGYIPKPKTPWTVRL